MIARLFGIIPVTIEIPEWEETMASVEELQANVDNLRDKFSNMQNRIAEDVQHLKDQVAELEQAGGVDQDKLDQINATVESIGQQVDSIDPVQDFPAASEGGGEESGGEVAGGEGEVQ